MLTHEWAVGPGDPSQDPMGVLVGSRQAQQSGQAVATGAAAAFTLVATQPTHKGGIVAALVLPCITPRHCTAALVSRWYTQAWSMHGAQAAPCLILPCPQATVLLTGSGLLLHQSGTGYHLLAQLLGPDSRGR